MSIATTTELICFLVLSAVVVLGALGVVLLSNIVYSAFLLGGVFMDRIGQRNGLLIFTLVLVIGQYSTGKTTFISTLRRRGLRE